MKEKIFYVCDKKECDGHCPNDMCFHTENIEHAAYFEHTDFDEYTQKVNGIDTKLCFERIKNV